MPELKFVRWIGNALDMALSFIGVFMSSLLFYNVISRYVFNLDLAWSSELATIVLVWGTLLGAASACRHQCHLVVHEFINKLPAKARWYVEIYICAMSLLFVSLMSYYGYSLAVQSMEVETMALGWPMGVTYAAMPVGGICMIIFILERLRVTIISKRIPEECECKPAI